jgi:hypothetical protein
MELAVKTGAAAAPAPFVTTLVFPLNVPLGPLAGAVNTTVTPGTGFPLASRTVATSGAAKGVFTVALCGVPPVAEIDAGPPLPPSTVIVRVVPVMKGGPVAVITEVPGARAFTRNWTVVNALPSG